MPYAEGRPYYDADSHVMELPEWLPSYVEPAYRDRIRPFSLGSTGTPKAVRGMIERARTRAGNDAERGGYEHELLTRKSWDAYGAFHAADRSRALDLLGFQAQLVEGGRNPLKRFNESLQGRSEAELTAFYSANFADLVGLDGL